MVKLKSGVVSEVTVPFAGEFDTTVCTTAYAIGIAKAIIEMTKSAANIVLNLFVTMLICKFIFFL